MTHYAESALGALAGWGLVLHGLLSGGDVTAPSINLDSIKLKRRVASRRRITAAIQPAAFYPIFSRDSNSKLGGCFLRAEEGTCLHTLDRVKPPTVR